MPTRQRITFANRTGEQLAAALPLDAALERSTRQKPETLTEVS